MSNDILAQGSISLTSKHDLLASECPAPTIVVGLGNPILGDDGIGWRVAEEVQRQISQKPQIASNIHIEFLSVGGISLMENLIGYRRDILIDAINLNQKSPGHIYCFPLQELPEYSGGHITSTHDTSLPTALRLGASMGASLPGTITIVGIESASVYDFSEELTPPIAEAVPVAAKLVMSLLLTDE